jgi:acyl carrier protein
VSLRGKPSPAWRGTADSRRRSWTSSSITTSNTAPARRAEEFDSDTIAAFDNLRRLELRSERMAISLTELKANIIACLNLQDITPEQIEDGAPLFGTGLGLDSIDALELVVMLEKNYNIVIKDIEEGRPAFQSVRTLAAFIDTKRTP